MSYRDSNSWSNGAIRKTPPMPGNGRLIMEIAEKLRPWLTKMFENVRDENGMIVQPARIRGIALNVAQDIINEQMQKSGA